MSLSYQLYLTKLFLDCNQSPLNKSLILVFARVFASTCLTITAQYRLQVPSLDGKFPDTTTDPAGTWPYEISPVARLNILVLCPI